MTQIFTLAELEADLRGAIAEIRESGQAALITDRGRFLGAILPFRDDSPEDQILAAVALDERRRARAESGDPILEEAEALLNEPGRRDVIQAAMEELRARTQHAVSAGEARERIRRAAARPPDYIAELILPDGGVLRATLRDVPAEDNDENSEENES